MAETEKDTGATIATEAADEHLSYQLHVADEYANYLEQLFLFKKLLGDHVDWLDQYRSRHIDVYPADYASCKNIADEFHAKVTELNIYSTSRANEIAIKVKELEKKQADVVEREKELVELEKELEAKLIATEQDKVAFISAMVRHDKDFQNMETIIKQKIIASIENSFDNFRDSQIPEDILAMVKRKLLQIVEDVVPAHV